MTYKYPDLWRGCIAAFYRVPGTDKLENRGALSATRGELAAGTATWTHTKWGDALSGNGSTTYWSVQNSFEGSSYNLNRQDAGAVSFWVKSTSDAAQTIFSSSDASANNSCTLCIGDGVTGLLTNELITLLISYSSTSKERVAYTTATRTELFDGNWHHVVVASDGVGFDMWLDGAPLSLTIVNGSESGNWLNSGGLTDQFDIGRWWTGSSAVYMLGSATNVLNLRVYDRTLSQAEITLLASRQDIADLTEPEPLPAVFDDNSSSSSISITSSSSSVTSSSSSVTSSSSSSLSSSSSSVVVVPVPRVIHWGRSRSIETTKEAFARGDVRLNRSSSQADGLVLLVPHTGPTLEKVPELAGGLVDGELNDLYGTPTLGTTRLAHPTLGHLTTRKFTGSTNDCISGTSSALLDATDDIAMSFWFLDNGLAGDGFVWYILNSAVTTTAFGVYVPGANWQVRLGSTFQVGTAYSTVTTKWQHIACSYNNTSGRFRFWKNGIKTADTTTTTGLLVHTTNGNPFIIGTREESGHTSRKGFFVDVRVYNRDIGDIDVWEMYSNPADVYEPISAPQPIMLGITDADNSSSSVTSSSSSSTSSSILAADNSSSSTSHSSSSSISSSSDSSSSDSSSSSASSSSSVVPEIYVDAPKVWHYPKHSGQTKIEAFASGNVGLDRTNWQTDGLLFCVANSENLLYQVPELTGFHERLTDQLTTSAPIQGVTRIPHPVFGSFRTRHFQGGKTRDVYATSSSPELDSVTDFTLSFWALETGNSGEGFFWYILDSANSADAIGVYVISTDYRLRIGTSLVVGAPYVLDYKWHHVAYSYNNTTGRIRCWKDGVLVTDTTTSTGLVVHDTTGNDVIIGSRDITSQYSRVGYIVDCRIYGYAMDDTAVKQIYQNPQDAYAPLNPSPRYMLGTTQDESSSSLTSSSSESSSSSSSSSVIPDTISITSTSANQIYQRTGNSATVTISGGYTGDPTAIEWRHAGGAWATLDASPTGGNFSGSAAIPEGTGLLEVRFANSISVTDSVADVGVGDVFLVAGQSNAEGRGSAALPYSGSLKSGMFREDLAWAPLSDHTDPDWPSSYSAWPYLGTLLEAELGVPVAFITTADGATSLGTAAAPGDWYPVTGGGRYENSTTVALAAQTGGFKAILWYQGERDVADGTSKADYKASLGTLVDSFQSDLSTSAPMIIAQLGDWTGATRANMDAIREAQSEAWTENAKIYQGPLMYDTNVDDGVHFVISSKLAILSRRWFLGIKTALYGGTDTAPILLSATETAAGDQIDLVFDQNLKTGNWFNPVAWILDSASATLSSVGYHPTNPDTLRVYCSGRLSDGDSITMGSHTDASGVDTPETPLITMPDATTVEIPAVPFYSFAITIEESSSHSSSSNSSSSSSSSLTSSSSSSSSVSSESSSSEMVEERPKEVGPVYVSEAASAALNQVQVRGRWLVDEGVATRWDQAGLDNIIKGYWPNAKKSRYPAVHDEQARPGTPHPYVVYESAEPIVLGHSTGGDAGHKEQQYQDVPIQFRVHAKGTNTQSGKSIAKEVAIAIKLAFDPGNDFLQLSPDCHLCTLADGDFPIREGDEEWVWVVQYRIRLDATYLRGES